VNSGSGLPIRNVATAVKVANKRLGAGDAGTPVSAIGPARRAKSGAAGKVNATGNASGSKRPRWPEVLPPRLQLEPAQRARASAQQPIPWILPGDLAAGRVVTKFSRSGCVRRLSDSVRALAVRRYDVCSTGRRTGGDGIVVRDRGVSGRHARHRTPLEVVSPYCEAA